MGKIFGNFLLNNSDPEKTVTLSQNADLQNNVVVLIPSVDNDIGYLNANSGIGDNLDMNNKDIYELNNLIYKRNSFNIYLTPESGTVTQNSTISLPINKNIKINNAADLYGNTLNSEVLNASLSSITNAGGTTVNGVLLKNSVSLNQSGNDPGVFAKTITQAVGDLVKYQGVGISSATTNDQNVGLMAKSSVQDLWVPIIDVDTSDELNCCQVNLKCKQDTENVSTAITTAAEYNKNRFKLFVDLDMNYKDIVYVNTLKFNNNNYVMTLQPNELDANKTISFPNASIEVNKAEHLSGSTLPSDIQLGITKLGAQSQNLDMNGNSISNLASVSASNNFSINPLNKKTGFNVSGTDINAAVHIVNVDNTFNSFQVDDSSPDTTVFKVSKDGNVSIKSSSSNISSSCYINTEDGYCGLSITSVDSLKTLTTTKATTVFVAGADSDYSNKAAGSLCLLGANASQAGSLAPFIDIARTNSTYAQINSNGSSQAEYALPNDTVIGKINFIADNGTNIRTSAVNIEGTKNTNGEGQLNFNTTNSSGTNATRFSIVGDDYVESKALFKDNGVIHNIRLVTSNYTAVQSDHIIFADTSSGNITIRLGTNFINGTNIFIKNIGDNPSNVVNVSADSNFVNGQSSLQISQLQSYNLHTFNGDWY